MEISHLEVDTAQLNADIRTIDESVEQVKKSLDEMTEELAALNTAWSGTAHQTFQSEVAQDEELVQEIAEEMSRLLACMIAASKEYVSCEKEVRSLVDSISI